MLDAQPTPTAHAPDAHGDDELGVSVFADMAPNRMWYDTVDGRRAPHWRAGHARLYGKVCGGRRWLYANITCHVGSLACAKTTNIMCPGVYTYTSVVVR